MQRVEHRAVHDRGGGRRHVDDQRRPGVVAGLGRVDLVADPGGGALLGVVHVRIVGQGDHPQGGWDGVGVGPPPDPIASVRPTGVTLGEAEVLPPDPAQGRDGRHVAQPNRHSAGVDGYEQPTPVKPDLIGAGPAGRLTLRDVELVDGAAVALDPGRIGVGAQPVWCDDRQAVRCGAQGPDGAAEAVEAADGSEDVSRIGALATTLGQEAVLAAKIQQGVEQQRLHATDREAGAQLAQDRAGEAGVGQGEPDRYFQSMLPRTASAARLSDRFSANCSSVTSASRQGQAAG